MLLLLLLLLLEPLGCALAGEQGARPRTKASYPNKGDAEPG